MDQHITTPITEEVTKKLHSGDYVYITGPAAVKLCSMSYN